MTTEHPVEGVNASPAPVLLGGAGTEGHPQAPREPATGDTCAPDGAYVPWSRLLGPALCAARDGEWSCSNEPHPNNPDAHWWQKQGLDLGLVRVAANGSFVPDKHGGAS